MSSPSSRTLLVMRHAHAEPGVPDGTDHARRLTARGRRAAAARGPLVRQHQPDLVVCSSARRTRETLDALALPPSVPVQLDDSVYNAGAAVLERVVASLADDVACALIIGHLPGVADLVRQLVGEDQRGGIGFDPGTVAVLAAPDEDWGLIGVERCRMLTLIR